MIQFAHSGQTVRLAAGEIHQSSVDRAYRDAPAIELEGIIAEVGQGRPWREVVAARFAQSNPWLFRIVCDEARDLFLRQHPCRPGARVLDVGAGWGQLTLPLARYAKVCALEPTSERLRFIRAAAQQDGVAGRCFFVQAQYGAVQFREPFDEILCIGVLEWVGKYSDAASPREAQREFLRKTRTDLRADGRLVLGIENRLGLKYILGSRDDHIVHPNIAVFDPVLADRKHLDATGTPLRTLTHSWSELAQLLAESGFAQAEFFAAFPDYKLPTRILRLGEEVETFLEHDFVEEHDGVDGSKLPFQDELRSHYRSFASLRISSNFVPSFFVVARP